MSSAPVMASKTVSSAQRDKKSLNEYVQYRQIAQLSKPGEIHEEYEAEVKRLAQGTEEDRRREEEASVALIQKLVTADNQQTNQLLQEKIARQDEKLARELAQEFTAVNPCTETLKTKTSVHLAKPKNCPADTLLLSRDLKGEKSKFETVFKDSIEKESLTSCKRKVLKSQDTNSSDFPEVSPSKSRRDNGDSSNENDEAGLSQEERDHRFALQLQKQFHLADKLHLRVLRFKGSNDAYSLRKRNQRK